MTLNQACRQTATRACHLGERLCHQALGTSFEELWWSRRGTGVLSSELAPTHPHREWLVNRLALLCPFQTLLEAGCGTAPNIEIALRRWPDLNCLGVEINPHAVAGARRRLVDFAERALIMQRSLRALSILSAKSIDVILTDATLLYIGKDAIHPVTQQFLRIARKGITFLEFHDPEATAEGFRSRDGWIRNYHRLLETYSEVEHCTIDPTPVDVFPGGRWPRYGALITARLSQA